MWGNRILPYTLRLSPIQLYIRHAEPASDHYGNAIGRYGDPGACARNVYQALSPPLEGPGNEAKVVNVAGALIRIVIMNNE